jgi:hypothetical protein
MDINNVKNDTDYKVQPVDSANKDRNTKVNQLQEVSEEENKAEKIIADYNKSVGKGQNIDIKA